MSRINWATRACSIFLLWAVAAIALPAQKLTTLHDFNGTDGEGFYQGLVQGSDGNLYGTAPKTIFSITPDGTFTTLYVFQGTAGGGLAAQAALVEGASGVFYGTTQVGGAYGYGMAFEIRPEAAFRTLHSFDSTDGAYPSAGMVRGNDGNFYGTTREGGFYSSCANTGCGTIFKITPGGTLTTLHSFDGTDGYYLPAGLILGTDGSFYGTTMEGGAFGEGTVFKITPSGTLTTLYSFSPGGAGGWEPFAGLAEGADGNFYGITIEGGNNNFGAIFKITPSGTLTTFHSFDGVDGVGAYAGMIAGSDGNLYGTTAAGGVDYTAGTAFEITLAGTLTTLYNFCSQTNCADGKIPYAPLIQSTNGSFYGTTANGGITNSKCGDGCGTIFGLSTGLTPFVEVQPAAGKVGGPVRILGNNLMRATSVMFNGTAATFTVVSGSEITTTVPTGATSGTVQVVTAGSGTLSSNVNFRVLP